MEHQTEQKIKKILADIYEIDPELVSEEPLLRRLIAELEIYKPLVTINQSFVSDLRASLITYKNMPTKASSPTQLPFLWWATRLAPLGLVALVLFVVNSSNTLSPTTITPAPEKPPVDQTEIMPYETEQMDRQMEPASFKSMSAPMEGDTSIAATASTPSSINVPSPQAGPTVTVAYLSINNPSWLVVSAERPNGSIEILNATQLSPNTYTNLDLTLARPLTYPEIFTVAVYSSRNTNSFKFETEIIQIDPLTNSLFTLSIPVISELELNTIP